MEKLLGFLRLTRPANIVTAVSDILAGAAITGLMVNNFSFQALLLLVLSTIGLYGGGVVFNDVFDANLDKIERPERPIPRGLISVMEGSVLGAVLLLIGIVTASFVSIYPSGLLALGIAIAALVYDRWGKHNVILGPLNMGLCRGLNLLLGMSLFPEAIFQFGYLAVVPILYIAAITMVSRGEVHGGKSITMIFAAMLYVLVMSCIMYTAHLNHNLQYAVIFVLLFALMTFPPLLKAFREPIPRNIGRAVRAGVLGLILMNASWAAASGAYFFALIIVLLLPISILMAKLFAVT